MLGSTYERGSSWAVEVGGNLKVCSIMVENLNKNGQMVVEVESDFYVFYYSKYISLQKYLSTRKMKRFLLGQYILNCIPN